MDIFEKEEHENISDSSPTGFEKVTDKGLVNFNSSDVRNGDRIIAESNRRLRKSIERFNYASSKYSKRIIWLTIILGIIAFMQLIAFFLK